MKLGQFSLTAVVCIAFNATAFAADVPIPDDTVASRVRPELMPTGVRIGSFTMFPQFGTRIVHDDNIYAQSADTVSDTVTYVTPRVDVRSDWSRHSLALSARAKVGRYADNTSENFEDVTLEASSRIGISRHSGLRLSARIASLHEERFSPDARDGLTPTEFDRTDFAVAYEREAGRVSLRLAAALRDLDFDDVAGPSGEINNDDRDRSATRIGFRTGYSLGEHAEIFLRGAMESIDYDAVLDDAGLARSSSGREIAVGAAVDLSALTSIEAFIGHTERDYDDATLDDLSSVWYGGALTWRISGLTTLSASATRGIEETTLDDAGGYVATRMSAAVDHELLRNLVLHLSVYRQENDYEGIERVDDITGSRFEAHYMMNRNLDIVFNYNLRDRDVRGTPNDRDAFDNNTVSLRVTGKR